MSKSKVVLAGAGQIGEAIAALLAGSGDYDVTLVDQNPERLRDLERAGFRTLACALAEPADLAPVLKGQDVLISACPHEVTPIVARAARQAGVNYFDLSEDVEGTREVRKLAQDAPNAFVPQCGLAPGFISIVTHDVTLGFESLRDVRMRVGALPVFPSNALKYNLTWSTDGLINEYCNRCEAIVEGVLREVPSLEEVESFCLDGVTYEAFNTSGGLGTLAETLGGRVENLNYKTVRYPGHRDIVKLLIRDLRLGENRDLLQQVLEAAIPMTRQDLVLVFVTVTGQKMGRLTQETFARKIYAKRVHGRLLTAIQLTTAAGICAMVDLHREGKLPQSGLVRQEQASLEDFLANRFGRHYAEGNGLSPDTP